MHRVIIAAAALPVLLILAVSPEKEASGFSCGWVCSGVPGDEEYVHQWITDAGLDFLRGWAVDEIKDGNTTADQLYSGTELRHLGYCTFAEAGTYINQEYDNWIIPDLGQARPALWDAANHFGLLLHTAQDLYAHSNWSEIWGNAYGGLVPFLYEDGLGPWRIPTDWQELLSRDGSQYSPRIIIGETHDGTLPADTSSWASYKTLVSDSDNPHDWTGRVTKLTKTNGDTFDVLISYGSNAYCYEPFAIEHDAECLEWSSDGLDLHCIKWGGLAKDRPDLLYWEDILQPSTPYFGEAYGYAIAQTRHEWCRLLNLLKNGPDHFLGTSVPLGLMVDPTAASPDCSDGEAPLAPIDVTVSVDSISVPTAGVLDPPFDFTFALYTGDLRESVLSEVPGVVLGKSVPGEKLPAQHNLCLSPADTLVMTVQGWTFIGTHALAGVTLDFDGPDFGQGPQSVSSPADLGISATFNVSVGGDDSDSDGLSDRCGESAYNTDPLKPDTDRDGLSDGDEVNVYGTYPLIPDSDGDWLSDGDEVNVYGTDPLDPDTDDDLLRDVIEVVGSNPTDPLDADSDDDGLMDGTEDGNHNGAVDPGETDPADWDTDGDGLSDGLERGLASPETSDTDTLSPHWQPDSDPSTTTDPTKPDTDGDGLADGVEDANQNGAVDTGETNPNDADSDDDKLSDALEVENGTDPLNPDSDGDGTPDGEDVEWVQNAIAGLPVSVFKQSASGLQTAMASALTSVEQLVAKGRTEQAINKLETLRGHVDGCGVQADNIDWITDCSVQIEIRGLIDLLIANLSS